MAAISQLGTAVMIGFEGVTLSGYIMESADVEQTGTQKEILDEDNAAFAVLVENLGKRRTITAIVKSGTTPETIRQGDIISLDGENHRVESASVSYNAEEARLSVTAINEDSITY